MCWDYSLISVKQQATWSWQAGICSTGRPLRRVPAWTMGRRYACQPGRNAHDPSVCNQANTPMYVRDSVFPEARLWLPPLLRLSQTTVMALVFWKKVLVHAFPFISNLLIYYLQPAYITKWKHRFGNTGLCFLTLKLMCFTFGNVKTFEYSNCCNAILGKQFLFWIPSVPLKKIYWGNVLVSLQEKQLFLQKGSFILFIMRLFF